MTIIHYPYNFLFFSLFNKLISIKMINQLKSIILHEKQFDFKRENFFILF